MPNREPRAVNNAIRRLIAHLMVLTAALLPAAAIADTGAFTASTLGDYGNVTVMEADGGYDADNPDGSINVAPRQAVAKEFFRTHKDAYDFLVIFTDFGFAMPDKDTKGFYTGVRNDTAGIGLAPFDNTGLYGSSGVLQGTIDMGDLSSKVSDPLDPRFEDTLYILSHELMHRWGARAKFKDTDGTMSSALLGKDGSHWSFLFDSGGSVLYGNKWRDNGNGTFTTIAPQQELNRYSPLDLYLMGTLDKSQVPPMLLIDSPGTDPGRLPEANVTVSGTSRMVTIDDIIAAMGPRAPGVADSQKTFKTAFIYLTRPGTFDSASIYQIENIRNGFLTRHSIVTDGISLVQVAPETREDVPMNPGVLRPPVTPRTTPANISEGVQWLMSNQAADGTWADLSETTERDTAAAVETLRNFTEAQGSLASALAWLGQAEPDNTDFLCRKIVSLQAAGQDVSGPLAELLSRRNSDGGWGSDRHYGSNPADTALALGALASAGYGDRTVLDPAVAYLKARQNDDGGWGSGETKSTVQYTSAVLSTFNKYRATYGLDPLIDRAVTFLAGRQNSDGGFGNSPSTVYDTARAVLVLRELDASTDVTNKGLAYLLAQQGGNGSWMNSPFETALAIDAVYKATVDPDLSIRPEDISFIPETITNIPGTVVVTANIWNLGRTSVPQARVVLYEGDPSAGSKIGEQVVAFPGQQATVVTFSAPVTEPRAYQFTIVVDPDDQVHESSRRNNRASRGTALGATYDLEVLPADITVSAGTVTMYQDVRISGRISNKGTMNAYNVQVRYFIDDPAPPFEIATQTVDIPAGATIINQVIWHANKAGVNMPLAVQVDPFDNFAELSETNNKASTMVTVEPLTQTDPNLTLSSRDIVITPSTVHQGDSINISAAVKNEGAAPANGIVVHIYRGVPGQGGVLLSSQTIASLGPGETAQVTAAWTDIQETGQKIIYVQADPDGLITEISENDNVAFATIDVLGMPDPAVSQESIVFLPVVVKNGDHVSVSITVRNTGDQDANNVPISVYDNEALIASWTIASIPGNYWKIVPLDYDSTGKTGNHVITAVIDPDNTYAEASKSNNRASRSLTVLDATSSVTEPYISPNGDGIKDGTQFSFILTSAATITVSVVNEEGLAVRTFSGGDLTNATAGSVTWDGIKDDGTVADDGQYKMQVLGPGGTVLKSASVTVDNNRSPFGKAIGTSYLQVNELLPVYSVQWYQTWEWFSDESGVLMTMQDSDSSITVSDRGGLYVGTRDGKELKRITPTEWTSDYDHRYRYFFSPTVSPAADKIAILIDRYDMTSGWNLASTQLYVIDRDGRNLTLIDSYDMSSGYGIRSTVGWSPDGRYIAYYVNRSQSEVWLADVATGATRQVDSLGYPNYIDTGRGPRWRSDGNSFAFRWYKSTSPRTESLRTVDLSGVKTDVVTLQGSAYIASIEPLSDNRLVLISGDSSSWTYSFSIIDAGNQKEDIATDIEGGGSGGNYVKMSPDERSYAFITWKADGSKFATWYDNGTTAVNILDPAGNVRIVYELPQSPFSCAGAIQQSMQWAADSTRMLFSIDGCYWSGYSGGKDDNYLALLETRSQRVDYYACTDCDSTSAKLLPAGGTALVNGFAHDPNSYYNTYSVIYALEFKTGDFVSITPTITGRQNVLDHLSPHGNYIAYRSSGYGYGTHILAMSSFLNLPTFLEAGRNKGEVVLSGTATDLNFGGYKLEYADMKDPDAWTTLAPPADSSVRDDVLAKWVPPYEGMFRVRLTAWDKAGNTATGVKTVSWDQYSTVTDLYLNYGVFSPNGDGIKDSVELHYRVTDAANLDFDIYDNDGGLVTTIRKSYLSPASDSILWDGRDSSGNIVPDGRYKIKVLAWEMSVVVDSTPPDMGVAACPVSEGVRYEPDDWTHQYPTRYLYLNVDGHAVDDHIKSWTLEYGDGANPQEWYEVTRGGESFAKRTEQGNLITPAENATVFTYEPPDVPWLAGKKFRLTAEDLAGNKRSVISDFVPEQIFITQWDEGRTSIQDGTHVGYDPFVVHQIRLKATIRNPLATLTVEYEQNDEWYDSTTVAQPGNGDVSIPWDCSQLNAAYDHKVRIKAVDVLGNVFYSNSLTVLKSEQQLGLAYLCQSQTADLLMADNKLSEDLAVLHVQFMGPDDPDHKVWADYKTYDTTKGDVIPRNSFTIATPGMKYGMTYYLRLIGTGASGKVYNSPVVENGCGVRVLLTIHPVPASCNDISKSAVITVSYDDPRTSITETSDAVLSLFMNRNGVEQLVEQAGQAALLNNKGLGHTVDTEGLPEGRYPVRAVLNYRDAHDHLQKSTGDADVLIVDHALPAAMITYPTSTQRACVVKKNGWYALPVSGIVKDAYPVGEYALEHSQCNNPMNPWCPAMAREEGKQVRIGIDPLQFTHFVPEGLSLPRTVKDGDIGAWDVTEIKGTDVRLRLYAKDINGNMSCHVVPVSLQFELSWLTIMLDKDVFSPNGDGLFETTSVNYSIDANATVQVQAFRLDEAGVPGPTPQRTITIDQKMGDGNIVWDGKDDTGAVVPDGRYKIAVLAKDQCANDNSRTFFTDVDTAPPTAVITYPKADSVVGNIVEIQGTVSDPHVQSYSLEAGAGTTPDTWMPIVTKTAAVQNGVLGTWKTFALTGIWTLKLTATDLGGNRAVTTVSVDLKNGVQGTLVRNLDVTPDLASPNGDGKLDSAAVTYELTDACSVRLEFIDGSGIAKRTVSTVRTAGTYTYIWDGRDDGGVSLPDGAYTARVTAVLSSDSAVTQSESMPLVLDSTAPTIDIAQPVDRSYTASAGVTVRGSISDLHLSRYAISYSGVTGTLPIDQGSQSRVDYSFGTLGDLPEGEYALSATASDLAQNESSKTIVFTVDRTPPAVKLDAPADGQCLGAGKAVDISGSIGEKNLESFTLRYGRVDTPAEWHSLASGTTVTALLSPFSWNTSDAALTDGLYTISLSAKDKAGLTGEATVQVIVDKTPPTAAITSLRDGDYVRQGTDIKGTVSDQNLDKYVLEFSEGRCAGAFKWAPIKTATAPVENGILGTWQALPGDGAYCLRLTASDKAGLSSEVKIDVTVDTHPPATPTLSGAVEDTTNGSFRWTANADPDLAGYNLYRNGQKVNPATIADTVYLDQNLADGKYTFVVKAQDAAGWESEPSNEVVLRIGSTGPSVRIGAPRDGGAIGGLTEIKGTAYSADGFKQYRISVGQGAAPSVWTVIRTSPVPVSYGVLASWDTAGLGENQTYSIKLEAENVFGGGATSQIAVTIDNAPPAQPVLVSAADNGHDITASWNANAEGDLAGYLLYRNDRLVNASGAVGADMSPYLLQGISYTDTALPDGTFRYYVIAADRTGNLSVPSNPIDVTIDTRPPHAEIIEPADLTTFGGKTTITASSPDMDIASVQFQYQKLEDTVWTNLGNAVPNLGMATNLDPAALGLSYGTYRLRAVATDRGQQVDPAPGTITVIYADLTPPIAPKGLQAHTHGDQVDLLWTADSGSDLAGYNVYRTLDGSRIQINTSLLSPTAEPAYQDAGVSDGVYRYDVTAVDRTGNESDPSSSAPATVYAPALVQPYTPSSASTVQIAGNTAVPYAVVSLLTGTSSGVASLGTGTADGSGNFTLAAALAPGENRMIARATDDEGNISRDSDILMMVYNEPPATPTGLAVDVQDHDVIVTWDPNTDADLAGYNLYRKGGKMNAPAAVAGLASASSVGWDYTLWSYTLPAWAADGDPSTAWVSDYSYGTFSPAWWQVDLGGPKMIDHLDIHWAADVLAGKDFEVQVWSGYAWITQATVRGNTSMDNVFDFNPSYRTDKVRIYVTDAVDTNYSKQIGISEVGLFEDVLVTAPSFSDAGLRDGVYSYAVAAVDSYGLESLLSSVVTATVGDVVRPDAPRDLAASAAGSTIDLSWTSNTEPDLAGYNLYRDSGEQWLKLNASLLPTEATAYSDLRVVSGPHRYRLTAVDEVGNESSPSEATATVYPPSAPAELVASVSSSDVTLSWSQNAEADLGGYNVYRESTQGWTLLNAAPLPRAATEYADPGLVNGTYRHRVTAADTAGNESQPSESSAKVSVAVLQAPANLQVTAPTEGRALDLAWDAVSGASGYDLYRSLRPGGPYTKVNDAVIAATIHADTGLLNGATYYYVVTAADAVGNQSSYSPEASGTPLSADLEPLAKPEITSPTTAGAPVTFYGPRTDISGAADGGEKIRLYRNNESVAETASFNQVRVDGSAQLWTDVYSAAVSADGRFAAFSYYGDIYVHDLAAGSEVYAGWGDSLSWSSDGKTLAYVSYDTWYGYPNIYLYDVETGSNTPLNDDPWAYEASPSWSSDGTRVAFVSTRAGSEDVWIRDRGQGTITQVTNRRSIGNAKVSPDGTKVAYFEYATLFVADLANNTEYMVNDDTDWWSFDWSPDSKELAFVSYRNGYGDIYAWNADSRSTTQMTDLRSYNLRYPVWSSDGSSLLFDNRNGLDTLTRVSFDDQKQVVVVLGGLSLRYLASMQSGGIAYIDGLALKIVHVGGHFDFTDIALNSGENDFFVTASDASGRISPPSDAITVIRDGNPQLGLAATAMNSDVVLNWSAAAAPLAASYRVYRRDGEVWNRIGTADPSAASYLDAGIVNGIYTYRITAVDSFGGESVPSNEASAVVSVALPLKPANLTVNPLPSGEMSSSWVYMGSPAAAGYILYRSTTPGGPYAKVNGMLIPGNSYLESGLTAGLTYYYVVAAVDAIGNEGPYSNEASGTTQTGPRPPDIVFPAVSGLPATLHVPRTVIYGSAEPGHSVDVYENNKWIGRTTAQEGDVVRSSAVAYDGNGAALSPDGKMFAYTINDFIRVRSVRDGSDAQLIQANHCGPLVWSPDSAKIAYSFDDAYGHRRVGMFDLATNVNAPVTDSAGVDEDSPSWSFDGTKLVIVQTSGSSPGIIVKDLVTGVVTTAIGAGPVRYASISPDGGKIAYLVNQSMYVQDLGSGPGPVVDDTTDGRTLSWSPDSKALAYVSRRNGSGEVHVLDVAAGNRLPVSGSIGDVRQVAWTANSRSVIFGLRDASGLNDSVWVGGFRSQLAPVRIMPDLVSVSYLGSSRTGTIGIISRDASGQYALDLMVPKGTFVISDVSLAPGQNSFTATAADTSGNISDAADSVRVTFDTALIADLSVAESEVYLYPAAPISGDRMEVNAVVRNASGTDAANVVVEVYVWNALDQMELLTSRTVPSLPAGSSQLITTAWDSTGKGGANRLVVVVDPDDAIAESNKENNTAVRDFLVAEQAGAILSLSLDAAQYGANETMQVSVMLGNSGASTNATLDVAIEDADGNIVTSFDGRAMSLAYGATSTEGYSWNTGTTYAGDYRVHAVLRNGSAVLAEDRRDFTITSDAAVNLAIVTERPRYAPGETVVTTAAIGNKGTNSMIPVLVADMMISDESGSTVFSDTRTVKNILPGASLALSSSWTIATGANGTYSVSVLAKDGMGTPLGAATTSFTISAPAPSAAQLTGRISVDRKSVLSGDPVAATYSVTNAGNADLAGVVLSIKTVQAKNQALSGSLSETVDLVRSGSRTNIVAIGTDDYTATDYLLVLQATVAGIETTLGNAYFRVEGAPSVPSLATPAAGSDVPTGHPVLTVNNASDPNDDRLTYEFELYGNSGLTQLIVAAGGIAQGPAMTSLPLATELSENETYFWRSRAFDGILFGEWMPTASFRVNAANDPPTAPTIASPTDNTEVPVVSPVLTVNNAADPDSPSLTYNFEVALDPNFSQPVASVIGVAAGTGTTSWQTDVSLSENTWYYWRVQADDWLDTGPWSDTARFLVNRANDAPTTPVVLLPSNNSVVPALNADITLQNSTDPDSPVISYSFEVDTVPTFDSPGIIRSGIIPAGFGTTTWQAVGLLDNTFYYVRAKATDGSAESPWSDVAGFFVNTANDAPTTPVIANPSNGAGVSSFTPALTIRDSADLDRDVLTYEFEVYGDANLTNLVVRASGVAETPATTSWTVTTTLIENHTYYWRARAFDGQLASGWTLPASFMVNTANDAPGAPTVLSPADGSTIDITQPTLTVLNAVDPDSDNLTYDFEVYNGSILVWSAMGIAEGMGSTSAPVTTTLTDNTVYQWRARAFDGDRYGPWTALAGFTVHLQQSRITVNIEIEPETLNKKSEGNWVMAEIELPHGYKASDVDVSSIRLEGTVRAVLWPRKNEDRHHEQGCEQEHDSHDHSELTVKFGRSDVIAVLPVENHVAVHITGTVAGTAFEGVDIIKVISSGSACK